MKRLFALLLCVATFAAVLFYHRGQAGEAMTVHDALANARQLIGKDITVMGTVEDNVAIFGVGSFEITSDDGNPLTVVSTAGVPLERTHVVVHGVLRQAFASGSSEKLILIEDPAVDTNVRRAQ